MVAEARTPSPPAFAVADTSRGPATQPIPVWTMGNRTPARSHSRVWSAGCVTGSRFDLGPSRAGGIENVAQQLQLLHARQPRLGHPSVGPCQRKAGEVLHLVDADAGVHGPQP